MPSQPAFLWQIKKKERFEKRDGAAVGLIVLVNNVWNAV
jgi:hypothetical protein